MGLLQVGLVGCGRWGSLILRDLKRIGCEVYVACRTPTSQAHAREGGARDVLRDSREFPRSVAGVVIATRSAEHAGSIKRAASLGVPIFVEKPLATDRASAERLVDSLGDRLFVMDKWRYHEGILYVKGLLEGGQLGRLAGLSFKRVQSENPHTDVPLAWTYLPHDLGSFLEITGKVPAPVLGRSDGHGSYVFAALGTDPWCLIEVSSRARKKERRMTAVFEGATIELDTEGFTSVLEIRRLNGSPTEKVSFPRTEPLLRELEAFVGHLKGGHPPRSSAQEGAAQVAVIERLFGPAESV